MRLDDLAVAVDRLADDLTAADAWLARADPGPAAFTADGPGRLFALGRSLHGQWHAALEARRREAAAHGTRLSELAAGLRQAAAGYREVDSGVARRHDRHGGRSTPEHDAGSDA